MYALLADLRKVQVAVNKHSVLVSFSNKKKKKTRSTDALIYCCEIDDPALTFY